MDPNEIQIKQKLLNLLIYDFITVAAFGWKRCRYSSINRLKRLCLTREA